MRKITMMKMRLYVLPVLFFQSLQLSAAAQPWSGILSSSRAIDWSRAGVSGGIPSRSAIHTTLNPGASTASIQAAINNCPDNGVILFAAGTFTITASLLIDHPIVLRGMGSSTRLVLDGNIIFSRNPGSGWLGGYPGPTYAVNWTAGYAGGDTVITLASTANLQAGMEIVLDELNDPGLVNLTGNAGTCGVTANSCGRNGTNFGGGPSTRSMPQITRIRSISGSTVTLEDPLYYTHNASRSPQAFFWADGNLRYPGVENMHVDAQNTDYAVNFSYCYGAWLRNVEVENIRRAAVYFYYSNHGQVEGCSFRGSSQAGPTNYIVEVNNSSAILVQNNLFDNTTSPILLEISSGCVAAYNYAFNHVDGWLFHSITTHLAHNYMNLFEGNIIDAIALDAVWGSGSHETVYRNRIIGYQPEKTNNRGPVVIQAWNRYNNVVGNVLGYNAHHTRYQVNRAVTGGNDDFIYSIGYLGNWYSGLTGYDDSAYLSLMRWGNFDYATDSVRWLASEVPSGLMRDPNPVPQNRNLPASLYLSEKPAWWCADIPWPPIGPDVTGLVNDIPAKRRYENAACPGIATEVFVPGMLPSGPVRYTVLNIKGQVVRGSGELKGRDEALADISAIERSLPNGLYVWVIRQGTAREAVRRIVLR